MCSPLEIATDTVFPGLLRYLQGSLRCCLPQRQGAQEDRGHGAPGHEGDHGAAPEHLDLRLT